MVTCRPPKPCDCGSNPYWVAKENNMSDGGKGSARRPTLVSDSTFDERWDAIFMREESSVEETIEDELNKITENNPPVA